MGEPSAEELAKLAAKNKKANATCLDQERTQGVEIFLNGCGVKFDDVRRLVVNLDESALNIENLGKVILLYPPDEEVAMLTTFKQENDPKELPWGRAEDFLISLMTTPHFKVRAESLVARGSFGDDFTSLSQDVAALKTCLSGIVSSTALPAIFAMVMQIGNYLNFGTKKGAQCGFSLDTLPLLARVEGFNDKTYSLMRFMMDSLESEKAVREGA